MKLDKKSFAVVFFACVVVLVLFIKPHLVYSSTELTVEAEGTAQIVDKNQVSAREKALQDFEKQAVINAVINLLGEDQFNQNREKLKKAIIERADRYLKTYKVVGEDSQEGIYHVKGEATIRLDSLKKDIASLNLKFSAAKPSEPSTATEGKRPPEKVQESSSKASQETEEYPQKTAPSLPIIIWNFDRSCDEQVEGQNAGDFFSEIFTAKLSEMGFTVATVDETSPQEGSKAVTLRGNFFCFTNKVSIRIELVQGDQTDHIDDDVPLDEETPIMDAIMTLAEISANHLTQTITKPGESLGQQKENQESTSGSDETTSSSKTTSEELKSSQSLPLWQIIIKDPHGGLYWEKIIRKLKESGANIEVSRILISPDTFTIETPKVPENITSLIETISAGENTRLKVESVDSNAHRIVIRSQNVQQ
ncbi:MAG: hypothetical protein WHS38_02455 [Thermodesulforhabdaceae bacterium]